MYFKYTPGRYIIQPPLRPGLGWSPSPLSLFACPFLPFYMDKVALVALGGFRERLGLLGPSLIIPNSAASISVSFYAVRLYGFHAKSPISFIVSGVSCRVHRRRIQPSLPYVTSSRTTLHLYNITA